ncbi:MAG: hypothetical protein WCO60_17935 [Verrucomicrobiota bacterium]
MSAKKWGVALTKEAFVEANQIALELAKLHKAGVLIGFDDTRAMIAAGALRLFGGRFDVDTSTSNTPRDSITTAS